LIASDFLRDALNKLNREENYSALNKLEQSLSHAIEATYVFTSFQTFLKSVQIRLITALLIESAVNVEGNVYELFVIYQ
tara:strand:- start:973 stop:1209 length:237 start_codon:yes stop_codon:yes gene_type:complete